MLCVYCNEREATSKEHIIQSALGSNFTSKKLICSDCNNFFSRKESGQIDQSLIQAYDLFRNLFSIWGDRNTPPPILRNVPTASGEFYDVAPGGVPFKPGTIRTIIPKEDGELEIAVESQNIEKAREQLFHLRRQYGDSSLVINTAVLRKDFLRERLHHELQIGGKSILKAVTKNIINFLFWLERDAAKPLEIDRNLLLPAINYVRYDTGPIKFYASIDFLNALPITIPPNSIDHYLFAGCHAGTIFGLFIVFGKIQYSAVIAKGLECNDFIYGYHINPKTFEKGILPDMPSIRFDASITENFPTHATQYFPILQDRMSQLISLALSEINENELLRISNNVLDRYKGQKLPDTEAFITEMAAEVTKFIYKIPTEIEVALNDES